MAVSRKKPPAAVRSELDPQHWLGTTPKLDLADDRLRMRAQSITQLAKSERERALAIYAYVKAIRFGYPSRLSFPTAREVLDSRTANNYSKSTLFVALLRLARLPARVRMVQLRGDILQGYFSGLERVNHALVEVWLDGRWIKTDSHTYDAAYMAQARERLAQLGWDRGLCILRKGHPLWDGKSDVFSALSLDGSDAAPLADLGAFNDPYEFVLYFRNRARSQAYGIVKGVQFRVVSTLLNRGIRKLREGGAPGQEPTV